MGQDKQPTGIKSELLLAHSSGMLAVCLEEPQHTVWNFIRSHSANMQLTLYLHYGIAHILCALEYMCTVRIGSGTHGLFSKH